MRQLLEHQLVLDSHDLMENAVDDANVIVEVGLSGEDFRAVRTREAAVGQSLKQDFRSSQANITRS